MSKHVSLRKTLTKEGTQQQPTSTRPAGESAPSATPAYDDLVRKEARLRPEQIDAISRLRRRLNADRTAAEKPLPTGQRNASIQDHVITRAAITFLLENADAIDGWTEEDVLESLRRLKR